MKRVKGKFKISKERAKEITERGRDLLLNATDEQLGIFHEECAPIDPELVERIDKLVGDINVDLDQPLGEEDET